MTLADRFEKVEITSAQALEEWLAAHHAEDDSYWLVTWKKHTGDRYVPTGQVLDALVAWGWIDGPRLKLDDDRIMQLISRRRTAQWAHSYKERAARLIADGRMRAPGRDAVEAAKRAGLWDALSDVDALIVPDDLAAALATSPPAADRFAAFAPSARRNILRWIAGAKTQETRARRIATTATLAARNERPPHM